MQRTMWASVKFWLVTTLRSILVSVLALCAPATTQPAVAQNVSSSIFDPNATVLKDRGGMLGPDEQAILLQEIESYFNSVGTLRARFMQFNMDGSIYQGDILIDRPGKMRIDYDDPIPYLIVADGQFYIFVDEQLEEASHIPLGLTPANMLLRRQLKLGKELTVMDAARDDGALFITVAQVEVPDAGTLTLAFEEEPLSLRQWTVIDAQGIVTRVLLINPEIGVGLDPASFTFINPWISRVSGN